MAEQNLRIAAELAGAPAPSARSELGVDDEEIAAWRDAANAIHVPYDERLQVHPQAEGFTRHAVLDFEDLQFPLLLHVPYFRLYSTQVVKQADLVLALYMRGDRFTRRGEGARLRLLRGDHGPRQLAFSAAPRRSSRPRSATSSSPTTTSARPPGWTSAT